MFGLNEEILKKRNGLNTAREIFQQPELWLKTLKMIDKNQEKIKVFLNKFERNKNTRIIFTGAGTSGYIGEIAVPYLNSKYKYRFESIPTTDIVSNPKSYFESKTPTILVSFARSGNSPESIAVYNLAEQLLENISHIFVTCNPNGQLAKTAEENKNSLLLLMPENSNDKGFAMTSSFTNMLLASLLIFDLPYADDITDKVEEVSKLGTKIIEKKYEDIKKVVDLGYDRIIFLGSGSLEGLAKESALKVLELTSGKIVSCYESCLGFRHGPKSIVDDKTLVFIYMSDDEYTKKYDLDIVKELYQNEGNHKVICISNKFDEELDKYSYYNWYLSKDNINLNEVYISVANIIYVQLFALFSSLKIGIEPDNPSPSGVVNRVVKGVKIYNFK